MISVDSLGSPPSVTYLKGIKNVQKKAVVNVDRSPTDEKGKTNSNQNPVGSLPSGHLPDFAEVRHAAVGEAWERSANLEIDDANGDTGDDILDKEADDGVGAVISNRIPAL